MLNMKIKIALFAYYFFKNIFLYLRRKKITNH